MRRILILRIINKKKKNDESESGNKFNIQTGFYF